MPKRRIDVKFIENKAARLITFSKRRKSLFKKAKELSTLCHAEVGVVVVSEAQRVTHEANPISIHEIFGKLEIDERVNQPLENSQLDDKDFQFSTELEEFQLKIRKGLRNLSIEKLQSFKNFIEKMGLLLKEKEIHLKEEEGQKKETSIQLGVEMLCRSNLAPNPHPEDALDLTLRLGRG